MPKSIVDLLAEIEAEDTNNSTSSVGLESQPDNNLAIQEPSSTPNPGDAARLKASSRLIYDDQGQPLSWEQAKASPYYRMLNKAGRASVMEAYGIGPAPVKRERGLLGDIGTSLARSGLGVVEQLGGALETADLTPENKGSVLDRLGSGLRSWAREKRYFSEAVRPDIEEATGQEGLIKRTARGAIESLGGSLAPVAAGAGTGFLVGGPMGMALGTATGIASLFGLFGGGTYAQKFQQNVNDLILQNPEEAKKNPGKILSKANKNALVYAGAETLTELGSDVIDMLTFKAGRFFEQPLKATIKELLSGAGKAKAMKEFGKDFLKANLAEVPMENLNYYLEQKADNAIKLGKPPTLEGIAETTLTTLWMTAMMGAAFHNINAKRKRMILQQLNSPNPEERIPAIQQTAELIKESTGDEEFAKHWLNEALDITKRGGEIPTDERLIDLSGIKFQMERPEKRKQLEAENLSDAELSEVFTRPDLQQHYGVTQDDVVKILQKRAYDLDYVYQQEKAKGGGTLSGVAAMAKAQAQEREAWEAEKALREAEAEANQWWQKAKGPLPGQVDETQFDLTTPEGRQAYIDALYGVERQRQELTPEQIRQIDIDQIWKQQPEPELPSSFSVGPQPSQEAGKTASELGMLDLSTPEGRQAYIDSAFKDEQKPLPQDMGVQVEKKTEELPTDIAEKKPQISDLAKEIARGHHIRIPAKELQDYVKRFEAVTDETSRFYEAARLSSLLVPGIRPQEMESTAQVISMALKGEIPVNELKEYLDSLYKENRVFKQFHPPKTKEEAESQIAEITENHAAITKRAQEADPSIAGQKYYLQHLQRIKDKLPSEKQMDIRGTPKETAGLWLKLERAATKDEARKIKRKIAVATIGQIGVEGLLDDKQVDEIVAIKQDELRGKITPKQAQKEIDWIIFTAKADKDIPEETSRGNRTKHGQASEEFDNFVESLPPMQKARAKKALFRKIDTKYGLIPRIDFLRKLAEEGYEVTADSNGKEIIAKKNSAGNITSYFRPQDGPTKTGIEYFKHITQASKHTKEASGYDPLGDKKELIRTWMKKGGELAKALHRSKDEYSAPFSIILYDKNGNIKKELDLRILADNESYYNELVEYAKTLRDEKEEYERQTEHDVRIETEPYNHRRYSKPWIAKVTFKGTKPNYQWGDWVGTHGEAGVLVIKAKEGDIIAKGQKDRRGSRPSSPEFFKVWPQGKLERLGDRAAAFKYWESQRTKEAKSDKESKGRVRGNEPQRHKTPESSISKEERGAKKAETDRVVQEPKEKESSQATYDIKIKTTGIKKPTPAKALPLNIEYYKSKDGKFFGSTTEIFIKDELPKGLKKRIETISKKQEIKELPESVVGLFNKKLGPEIKFWGVDYLPSSKIEAFLFWDSESQKVIGTLRPVALLFTGHKDIKFHELDGNIAIAKNGKVIGLIGSLEPTAAFGNRFDLINQKAKEYFEEQASKRTNHAEKKTERHESEESEYGKDNKVFTKDAAEKAREVLRKKLGQVSSGTDPELLQAGITLAGFHFEAGARSAAAWSKKMIADVGRAVIPYLQGLYENIRHYPGLDTKGITAPDEASRFFDELKKTGEIPAEADTAPKKKETGQKPESKEQIITPEKLSSYFDKLEISKDKYGDYYNPNPVKFIQALEAESSAMVNLLDNMETFKKCV